MAVSPAGDSVAVWSRFNGLHTIVQGAVRPAGGGWGPSADLSLKGRNAEDPGVAIDAAGTATAIWRRHDGAKYIVQVASRPAGGSWGPTVDLSAVGENAEDPQIAVGPAGDAVAVWRRFNGTRFIVQAASRPAGGSWGPAFDLSAVGQNAETPQVAISAAGVAVVVWSRYDGAKFVVQAARRGPGGAWEPVLDVSAAGQNAEEPQVAIDAAGNAVAVWSRFDGAKFIVQASFQGAGGGAWSSAADLSASGENSSDPQVAIDAAGNAIAVWARENSPTLRVQAARHPAGGAWEPGVNLSRLGDSAEEPEVAMAPGGDAMAVWSRTEGSPRVVEGSAMPAGGAWEAPSVISVIGQNASEPEVAADPTGNRVAVWAREDGTNTIVQAAGYDGAGPLIGPLSIPSAGTVRRPLSFSASAFDVWSALGPFSWAFGDGDSAGGAAVSHGFARPGSYQVTVTATDELAIPTTATAIVRIYPKPNAGRNVPVKGRKGLLRLRCLSPTGCQGTLRLVAPTEIDADGKPVGKRRQIGRASFAIPGPAKTTIRVPLTRKGRAAVLASSKGLKAQLTGPGVKHRVVVLFPPKRPSR